MKNQLSIQNISKSFGDKSILNDLTFDLKQGEILSFLGNSGSGKSTLLRIIAGFETADSGEIISDSNSILRQPSHKRNIGMFFQNYALFPHLNVEDNIGYGLHKSDKNRIYELIKLCKLDGEEKKLIHQISGGQQQRVALARALAPKPKVLLLDEPFSNIDAQLKDELRHELKIMVKQAGISAIFVSHDIDDAFAIADRALVLNEGFVQQLDRPEILYKKPINKFVAKFMGDAYFITGEIQNGLLETQDNDRFICRMDLNKASFVVRKEDFILHENPKNGSFKISDVHFKRSFKEVICRSETNEYKVLISNKMIINIDHTYDLEIENAHHL